MKLKNWVAGLITSMLLLLALWLVLSKANNEKVTWFTTKQFNQATGDYALAKFTRRLLSPVKNWIARHRHQPNVNMSSKLLALNFPFQSELLGPALSTNYNGLKAWILPEGGINHLISTLERMNGVEEISAPQVLTKSGMMAQVQTGNVISYAGKQIPVGLTITTVPKIRGNSVLLFLDGSYSANSSTNATSPPKLEFEAICRATIPDGGAIVIVGHNPLSEQKNDYLLMLSPVQIDARGRRVNSKP